MLRFRSGLLFWRRCWLRSLAPLHVLRLLLVTLHHFLCLLLVFPLELLPLGVVGSLLLDFLVFVFLFLLQFRAILRLLLFQLLLLLGVFLVELRIARARCRSMSFRWKVPHVRRRIRTRRRIVGNDYIVRPAIAWSFVWVWALLV